MGGQDRNADRKIGRLGSRAHGVVTRAELLAAGVTRREIERRLRRGALIRAYPGVYRVGHHAPNVDATYMAAVMACGWGAGLGGRAAGYHLGLIKGKPPPPEVTAPTERRVEGIKTHRSRQIELIRWRGIPTTTAARTLVDLAATTPEDELARACHEAGVRFRITPKHVRAVLEQKPNAPGAAKLWRIVNGDSPLILSKLEKGFLRRLRQAGLPLPRTNRKLKEGYVDCRWPDHGLTVELDSYRFHNSRRAWEQDRRREREAYGRGDRFRRYTWSDVFEQPGPMLRELRELLPCQTAVGATRPPRARRRPAGARQL
jgi:Transcriptional regulator, AbiEi antitoxin